MHTIEPLLDIRCRPHPRLERCDPILNPLVVNQRDRRGIRGRCLPCPHLSPPLWRTLQRAGAGFSLRFKRKSLIAPPISSGSLPPKIVAENRSVVRTVPCHR